MRTNYEILTRLGGSYISIGDYAKAKYCYEKAAILFPNHPEPHVGLGTVALHQKKFDDSESAFMFALKLSRDCSGAYCGLAAIYYQKGDFAGAFEMYLNTLELDSDNISALLGLFQTSRRLRSFSRIKYYIEVYLGHHPDDVQILYCLAALYVENDDFDHSKQVLLRILDLESAHTDAAELLEEVEKKLLRPDKA